MKGIDYDPAPFEIVEDTKEVSPNVGRATEVESIHAEMDELEKQHVQAKKEHAELSDTKVLVPDLCVQATSWGLNLSDDELAKLRHAQQPHAGVRTTLANFSHHENQLQKK